MTTFYPYSESHGIGKIRKENEKFLEYTAIIIDINIYFYIFVLINLYIKYTCKEAEHQNRTRSIDLIYGPKISDLTRYH